VVPREDKLEVKKTDPRQLTDAAGFLVITASIDRSRRLTFDPQDRVRESGAPRHIGNRVRRAGPLRTAIVLSDAHPKSSEARASRRGQPQGSGVALVR
jgi:hypothetical protein